MIIERETAVGSEATATGTGTETGEAVEGEEDITEGLRGAADQGAHRGEVESETGEVLSTKNYYTSLLFNALLFLQIMVVTTDATET